MNKIIGFIPAKGNSTRVPFKNKRTIAGIPLFLWAANNLSRVIPKKNIYVDSDCESILRLSEINGFSTIVRPKELADNSTCGNKLLEWEISNVPGDIYVQHLPPMPFCRTSTVSKIINSILLEGFDSSFVVHKERLYQWSPNGPKYDIRKIPNSFTLDETISEGMGLYAVKSENFKKEKIRVAGNFKMIEVNSIEKIDIDYPEDFELASIVGQGLFGSDQREYIDGLRSMRIEY